MDAPFPHPEDLNRQEIACRQEERLRGLLHAVLPANPFWSKKFAEHGVQADDVRSLGDLTRLPLTSKAEIIADYRDNPPYGSNLTYQPAEYARMHQTSGTTTGHPLRWLDTPASWNWILECWAAIYRLVGLKRDDRLAFPSSFGPFLGFWAGFDGAGRLGNLCLAGGGMSSRARLKLISENGATIVCCTPTYALRLADVADETGLDLASGTVKKLIVAGEPGGGIPATRKRIETTWGARVFDHWGMTELGSLAVECAENPGGLHLLESECIAEILDPRTGQPADPGTEGELVVTNLGRLGSPMIRYRTGDIVRADEKPCPCGRALLRLQGGILGRTDEMVTIRGNNVFPSSLEAVLREFDEIAEYRITLRTVRSMNALALEIEPTAEFDQSNRSQERGPDLAARVASVVKDRLNFHVEVSLVPCGQLPRFELKGRRFVRES